MQTYITVFATRHMKPSELALRGQFRDKNISTAI